MSNLSRIDQLLAFVKEEPENPFNLYALALEYLSTKPEEADRYFTKLLKLHKGYLPTYFHAAAFYTDQGELAKAKSIYEEGLQLAQMQGNGHALKELKNAFQNFCFEFDV
ncbi:tetratricopeptide repeat protein [Pararhodonellum marinum]|uniref:tetratricopeptide repeat protein n=1 Tax=Pararhodonellum marinum TaxID=2755358 RepID=UPI001890A55E|nr:tetratricopeptide repeat protein [Pararhodonellum marinum]